MKDEILANLVVDNSSTADGVSHLLGSEAKGHHRSGRRRAGGTDQQSMLLLIQSPQTEVLGITVVTGDQWLKAEVAHTLRMLELIARTDIPVVPGAEYPLVRRKEETELWEQRYGSIGWLGAWTPRFYHPANELGEIPEGKPTTKPADEDAAHFLIRMVHEFPNEITIYEGGPMTNLALAISIDPEFAGLAKELVFMGASLNPQTTNPEFVNSPRREFNLWFDPEAAHIVLRAPWKKIVCTTVDISVKTRMTSELINQIKAGDSPATRYVGTYARLHGEYNYLWDELAAAAWLDPSLITARETRFMDVNLDRGAGCGDTLTWADRDKPNIDTRAGRDPGGSGFGEVLQNVCGAANRNDAEKRLASTIFGGGRMSRRLDRHDARPPLIIATIRPAFSAPARD